jgi:TP901 family phage tail tape measure protein
VSKVFQVAFEIAGRMGASFTSSFTSASAQMRTMGAQSVALRSNLKTLDAAYQNGTINLESYRNAQARMKAQLEQTQSAQSRLLAAQSQQNEATKRASEIRGKMMDTAGLAAPLVLATRSAINFETAMGGVAKQVQGARDDNGDLTATYYQMQSNVMQLSRDLRMLPDDVANTTAAAARMGVQGTDALNEFVKMSVQMGVAFEGSGEQIAEQMAKIAHVRGIKIDTLEGRQQLKDFADTINYLDDQTTAKGPEIIEVLQRISGTAGQSSFSNNELAALATTMLDLGKTPEVAATGLNALMNRIATAPSQAKPFQQTLAALNIDAQQLQASYMSDSKGTLFSLLDKIKGLDKAEQANVLTGLFGAEYQDDISALAAGMDTLRGNMDMLNDSARQGSMEKEFAAKLKLTASSMDGLKQSVAETGISLTQTFLPGIVQVSGALQSGAQHLLNFQQQHPQLTNAIVITTAGLIGFRLAWLATSFTMNQYKDTAAGIRLLLAGQNAQMAISRAQIMLTGTATRAAAAGQWLWNAAMLANPVGLMIAGVTLLIGGLYLLYQHFDVVRNAIDGAWQKFATTFPNASAVLQSIGDKVGWLADKFKGLIGLQQDSSQVSFGSFRTMEGSTVYPHATGGIFTKPHIGLMAEAGYAEAAIPIDGSARSVSLWQQTGELLGVSPSESNNSSIWDRASNLLGGGDTFQITYAPVIQGGNREEIMPELQREKDSFMDQFKEIIHQRDRVSYG